jgi:hypothetical protein
MRNAPPVSGGALPDEKVLRRSLPDTPVTPPVPRSLSRETFVARLLALGRSCGDIPIYGSREWEALDSADPRRFAAVVAAAECWRQDGEPDRVRERLLDELAVADLIARWRVRMAGHDVRGTTDWQRVQSVAWARREAA